MREVPNTYEADSDSVTDDTKPVDEVILKYPDHLVKGALFRRFGIENEVLAQWITHHIRLAYTEGRQTVAE